MDNCGSGFQPRFCALNDFYDFNDFCQFYGFYGFTVHCLPFTTHYLTI